VTTAVYGYDHRKLRRQWQPRVDAGNVVCAHPRCGLPILEGEPWDLGHDPVDRTRWLGPMHRRCNRATSNFEKKLRPRRRLRWRSPLW